MAEAAAQIAHEPKGAYPQAAPLQEFLRQYSPVEAASAPNMLSGRWRVESGQPLPEYDTRTARAFAATDLTGEHQCYALVCRIGTVQRQRFAAPYKANAHPNTVALLAFGAVELSQPQEERFVFIYARPRGRKLSELRAGASGEMNETFIIRQVLAPLVSGLQALSLAGIAHGGINPDNIYYDDVPQLGDCLSAPCGYGQPFYFEPLERMQALAAAKGEGTSAQDCYALGVLALYLIFGARHFASLTQEGLIHTILLEGPHTALIGSRSIPSAFDELLLGTLTLNASDRWDLADISAWVGGKRFNNLASQAHMRASRPFVFAGEEAGSRREVAHLFFRNWGHIAETLTGGQLVQWLSVTLRNKELTDQVVRLAASVKDISARNDAQLNEQLMRLLLILDPNGPIRIGPLALHLDGIDALIAELFAQKAEQELQLLGKFIEFNMSSYWLDQQRKGHEYVMPLPVNDIMMKLDKLRIGIRHAGLGFGVERMLYECNPDMPCLSPLFAAHYVATLPALLKKLDRLAARSTAHEPFDRHIAAFIAAKLGIQHEVRLHELAAVPALANHRTLVALKFLTQAQNKAGGEPLPGLAHWLALHIMPLFDHIKSRSLRRSLAVMLAERARLGSLAGLSEMVIESNYAQADYDSYNRAVQLFRFNHAEIAAMREGKRLDEESDRLGYGMAKFLAGIAVLLVILSLVGNS